MKKIFLLLLLIVPISIKALDCGNYKDSYCGDTCTYSLEIAADEGELTITIPGAWPEKSTEELFDVTGAECPSEIYRYHPAVGAPFPIYSAKKDENYQHNGQAYKLISIMPYVGGRQESNPLQPGNKYDNIETCDSSTYKYISGCGCMPVALTDLTSRLYFWLKIAAPALLLIVGAFDLIKAMSAQDEKGVKTAEMKLVKKFVAAVAVFLMMTLVQFLVTVLSNGNKAEANTTIKCLDYILTGYEQ